MTQIHKPIYLDNNSTTPLDKRVLDAMIPYFVDHFGNAASQTHAYGWQASAAVELARESISKNIGATDKDSIIFTSGTTESNNLAIKGIISACGKKPAHIITQVTEHKCILESCEQMEKLGHKVTYLKINSEGFVNLAEFKSAFKDNTVLVSIMHANNEIGTIQDIKTLAKITHEHPGVLFHTDAAQSVGKIAVDVIQDEIDLMSFSAHKIYGPKGTGALYVAPKRPKISLNAIIHGGGHENGYRSGTLNVPAIVGFAKALELCLTEREVEAKRQKQLRDQFLQEIFQNLDHVVLNGSQTKRLPNNINLCIEYLKAEDLIRALPNLAFSTGSACSSSSVEPSYVIQALGRSKEQAQASIRLGLGRFTTEDDMKTAAQEIIVAVKALREKSLEYQMMGSK